MENVPELLACARGHLEAERWQEAEPICLRVLALQPCNEVALHLLCVGAFQSGNLRQALDYAMQSLAVSPQQAGVHNNTGLILQTLGEYEEAAARYRRAIVLWPNNPIAYFNLGNVLRDERRLDEARACYETALQISPNFAKAHVALACLQLLLGDFAHGWLGYEWRLKEDASRMNVLHPRWSGDAFAGKTVLASGEQGLGDTLQFVRYSTLLKSLGATVVLRCQPTILNLVARCADVDRVIGFGDVIPQFDVYEPLLSLPGVFKTTLKTIPAKVPYLSAEPKLVEFWRGRLAVVCDESRQVAGQVRHGVRSLLVGINWAGRSGPGLHTQRDIPVEHVAALATVPGLRLVSLQKGGGDNSHLIREGVINLGEQLDTAHGAFMDTAAIMMNLDLVITSDTSVAHLAGALGVPVWVALPFVPDWRWMLDRSDSPWYPTMRLFRQKTRGDWVGVFAEIEAALRERLESTSKMKI